jgi:late competence protein required for DNA uptake (superfamily II DNA/RNA helicase)
MEHLYSETHCGITFWFTKDKDKTPGPLDHTLSLANGINFNKVIVLNRIEKTKNGRFRRSFGTLRDINHFLSLYPYLLKEENVSYCEVLVNDRVNEYYDIEVLPGSQLFDMFVDDIDGFLSLFFQTRADWLFNSIFNNKVRLTPFVSNSSSKIKLSFHIVFKGMCFHSYKMLSFYMKEFEAYRKEIDLHLGVDMGVYHKRGCMRIVGFPKLEIGRGLPRFLKFHYPSDFNEIVYHLISEGLNSLSIDVDEQTKVLPLLKEDKKLKIFRQIRSRETEYRIEKKYLVDKYHDSDDEDEKDDVDEDGEETLDFISSGKALIILENLFSDCFSIKKKNDRFFSLERKAPSDCLVCMRSHERNCAFAFIKGGSLWLGCYASPKQHYCLRRFCKKGIMFMADPIQENELMKSREFHNEQVLDLDFEGKDVLLLKAYMGMGKTKSILKWMKAYRKANTRIIFLTSRKSFANCLHLELNKVKVSSKVYTEKDKKIKTAIDIVQVESLHKYGKEYDVVIVDECESVLFQMTSIDTHKDKIMQNHADFRKLLLHTKKVIMADAFLSSKTIDYVCSLKRPFIFDTYTHQPDKRVAYEYKKENQLLKNLVNDLTLGKNLFLFCSNVSKLLGKIQPYVQKKVPTVKAKYYSSYSKLDENEDIRSTWKGFNLIATTSTMTVGLNFDQEHFDLVYVILDSCSGVLVRDVFQAHKRVRSIRENAMCYHINFQPSEKCFSLKTIRRQILEENDLGKSQVNFTDCGPDTVELFCKNVWEANCSRTLTEDVFKFYLKNSGYEKIVVVDDESPPEKILFSSLIPDYVSIPEIDLNTFCYLCGIPEFAMKHDEKAKFLKSCFDEKFELATQEEKIDWWKIYFSPIGRWKIENIGLEWSLVMNGDLDQRKDKNTFSSIRVSKAIAIREICVLLEDSPHKGKIWLKNDLKFILHQIEKKVNVARKIFNLREKRKENKFDLCQLVKIIKRLSDEWGFFFLKRNGGKKLRRKKDEKGEKKEDDYEDVSEFIFGYHPIYNKIID